MRKIDTHKILIQLSTIDNRIVDEYTVEMWHRIIGAYEYADAELAIPVAFAESDSYMTPNRLLNAINRIRESRAEENSHRQLVASVQQWRSDPPPVCREHELPIYDCSVCKKIMAEKSETLRSDALHDWAVQEIYK